MVGMIQTYCSQLKQTYKIMDVSKWMKSSLVFGMAFMGLFILVVLISMTLIQYLGGTTPYLVDVFPQSYLMLQKIDRSFGGSSTLGFIFFFSPLFLIMVFYVLFLMEDYLDKLLGYLQKRNFLNRLALYWLLIALVPFPYFGAWVYSIFSFVAELDYGEFFWIHYLILILSFPVSIVAYSITFKVLSKQILDWSTVFKMGIGCGISFEVLKYLFILILKMNGDLSATKSLVIGLILFSIWFCISGAIYAMGGILGLYIQFNKVFDPDKRRLLGLSEARSTREIALICLLELIRRFYNISENKGNENIGLDMRDICEYCMITPKQARSVLLHMQKVKLIKILNDDGLELIVLNISPEHLKLSEFISIIEERKLSDELKELPGNQASCWFWSKYQNGMEHSFGDKTMKDLFEIQYGQISV